jgi:hypothetical protein
MEDVYSHLGAEKVLLELLRCVESVFFFFMGDVWGRVHLVLGSICPIAPAPDGRWWWLGVVILMRISRGNWVCGENLHQFHLVHHKSHMTWPGLEPMLLWWETGDCLSYGTVFVDRVGVLSVWRNSCSLRWSFPAAARLRSHGMIPRTRLLRMVPVMTVSYFRSEL